MGYIFVDIEFTEFNEGYQILEIGVYRKRDLKGFFRLVRPKDVTQIKDQVFKLLKQSKQVLMMAESIDKVMHEFLEYIRTGENLIIWGDKNAEILQNCLYEYGGEGRYANIIDLHGVLMNIQDRSETTTGFQNLLREYDITYDPGILHRSNYDAGLLKNLFLRMYEKYSEYIEPVQRDYVVNTRSKKIHKRNCRYLGYNLDIGYYTDFNADYAFLGCEFCICSKSAYDEVIMPAPDPNIRKMFELRSKVRKYKGSAQFSQKAVTEMCVLFGLNYDFLTPYILIKSGRGTWKIFHNNTEIIELHHSNYRNGIETEGFHRQKLYHRDLFGTLNYISNHDQGAFDTKGRLKENEQEKKQKRPRHSIKHISNHRSAGRKKGKKIYKRSGRDRYIDSGDYDNYM